MATLTIELTDISTEMLVDLAARAKERQANSVEEYVQTLIKQDHPWAKIMGSMSGATWEEIMEEMERERLEEDSRAI